ncbi:hypothetical protein VHEMI00989 [[Torrubiella] hemipterigena]|uniref:Uncharacterized protein n=1 Tax=[Torrubiella] hemipterigena TaxID=1531966 RepID=A0A0A1T658_9HYPO|nr:hypothetical protein VHEMI00989 [[Torrubiella] hemipterigena]
MEEADLRFEPFPAKARSVSGAVNGVETEITLTNFSDKILVTISQGGRLSQWVQVPLTGSAARAVDMSLPGAPKSLLPSTHLTPTTLFGGGGDDRETVGQLYAAQLASQIEMRNGDDKRTLVVGLGLESVDKSRETFFDFIELAQQVL